MAVAVAVTVVRVVVVVVVVTQKYSGRRFLVFPCFKYCSTTHANLRGQGFLGAGTMLLDVLMFLVHLSL